ncbi:hypothetical protein Scep_021959 [Stephania cephalantha]|uniref:Uncharacterized protein n=1 Tax=Stephania cephalantha TaxID=152367 RepID=A0AAP0F4F2_9MAGN
MDDKGSLFPQSLSDDICVKMDGFHRLFVGYLISKEEEEYSEAKETIVAAKRGENEVVLKKKNLPSIELERLKLLKPSDPKETLILISCVEMDGLTSDDDWLSEEEEEESIEELELNFTDISQDCTASSDNKVEKEVEVTFEWSNEPQENIKEDQPLVLVKPPLVPCICVEFYIGVEENEHLEIFYTIETFVLDVSDEIKSFVLEVQDKLQSLNEGMSISLSKVTMNSFVQDYSQVASVM